MEVPSPAQPRRVPADLNGCHGMPGSAKDLMRLTEASQLRVIPTANPNPLPACPFRLFSYMEVEHQALGICSSCSTLTIRPFLPMPMPCWRILRNQV